MSQWVSVLKELPSLHFKAEKKDVYKDEVFSLNLYVDVKGRIHVHIELAEGTEYTYSVHRHLKKVFPLLMEHGKKQKIDKIYTTAPKNEEKTIKWLTKVIGFVYNSNVTIAGSIEPEQILLEKDIK